MIVDCCYRIHCELGPGLLESVYESALCYELKQSGFNFIQQQPIPAFYKGVNLNLGFRADIIVENKVLIEIKSVEILMPVHKKQLLTYLKLSRLKLGLLINFNEVLIKDGITRIVNNL